MDYQEYPPSPDLAPLVKCYWTLEVPPTDQPQRQRIIPDGLIELAFILGDDIKRYTTDDEFIIQPRAMVLGQTIKPFYIEPTGYVNTFAIRFYPYGIANFIERPIKELANKETPLAQLFDPAEATELETKIIRAKNTQERIAVLEDFLMAKFSEQQAIDTIAKSTVDALLSTKGSATINSMLNNDPAKRRQLERKFVKHIGISPKQLGKVIRLQAALKMLLNQEGESLTDIAYQNEYYDQAHFIKDFKEFTGINPKQFLDNESMALSAIFYK